MFKECYILFLLLICFNIENIYLLKLPSYIKPCDKSLNQDDYDKCVVKAAQNTILAIGDGDAKYHLPSLKPLKIEKLEANNLDSIKIVLNNISITGLSELVVEKLTIRHNDSNYNLRIIGKTPRIKLNSMYDVNGQIFVLPVSGNGQMEIISDDTYMDLVSDFKVVERKGVKYLEHLTDKVKFTCKKAMFKLDNLFNGNKQLGDQMNELLNQNWQEVIKTFGIIIEQLIEAMASFVYTGIAERVPLEEFSVK